MAGDGKRGVSKPLVIGIAIVLSALLAGVFVVVQKKRTAR